MPFGRVLRLGKKVSSGAISARVLPSDEPRLGISVSRRYGNAVRRNTFKRRARAAFRKYHPMLPSVAVVISPVPESTKTSYDSIDKFFLKLCDYSA